MPDNHPLFKAFPLNGSRQISTGEVPTPYHVYDGHGLLIGGTADLRSAQDLLKSELVIPVQQQRRTFMAIWVCDFSQASLGPHHELQFSFFVSEAVPRSKRFEVLDLMTNPEAKMLCHGLWNSTATVVAYNREVLSLNARRAVSELEDSSKRFGFHFQDASGGHSVLSGMISNPRKSSAAAICESTMALGLTRVWNIARQPWSKLRILNPVGVGLARNGVADSYTKNRINRLRYFDVLSDRLEFGPTPYAKLGFEPHFVNYMDGFNFVYMPPE